MKAASTDGFRFRVITENGEAASHAWRVWTGAPRKSDVYVAASIMGRQLKASLHESGDFRYAHTSNRQHLAPAITFALGDLEVPYSSRTEASWNCRNNVGEDLTLALKIRFISNYLRPSIRLPEDSKPAIVVPAAPQGAATEVIIVLSKAAITVEANGVQTQLGQQQLPNKEYLTLGYRHTPVNDIEIQFVNRAQSDLSKKRSDPAFRKKMIVPGERGLGTTRADADIATVGFHSLDPEKNCLILWEATVSLFEVEAVWG